MTSVRVLRSGRSMRTLPILFWTGLVTVWIGLRCDGILISPRGVDQNFFGSLRLGTSKEVRVEMDHGGDVDI